MFEEDLFKFIPADSGIYDNAVLIAPEQESRHSRNFFGIIKTGDKCVPHSKANPKQRRKIENISKDSEGDGHLLPATADRILWSDKKFDVLQLTKKSLEESPPSVIKVASNCSRFSSEELSFGQNLLLHSCGKERRILAYDLTCSTQLEIPRDMECIVLWKDRQLKIKEVPGESANPIKVKVVQCSSKVDDFTGHVLLLQGEITSGFLVCSSIHAGWVDQSSLLVIPEALGTEFVVGEGLRGSGEKEEEWKDFVGMLRRSVRHQLDRTVGGYHEILVQEASRGYESPSLTVSKEQIACYENLDFSLVTYDDLQTLKPPKSQEPDDPVAPCCGRGPQVSTVHSPAVVDDDRANPINRPSISESNSTTTANEIIEAKKQTSLLPSPLLPLPPPPPPPLQTPSPSAEEKPNFVRSRVPANSKKNLLKSTHEAKTLSAPPPPPPPPPHPPQKSNSVSISVESTDRHVLPDKLDGLSCSEVRRCFEALDLGRYYGEGEGGQGRVNGRALSCMDAKDVERTFRMTPLEANKLSRFIRGWRP